MASDTSQNSTVHMSVDQPSLSRKELGRQWLITTTDMTTGFDALEKLLQLAQEEQTQKTQVPSRVRRPIVFTDTPFHELIISGPRETRIARADEVNDTDNEEEDTQPMELDQLPLACNSPPPLEFVP